MKNICGIERSHGDAANPRRCREPTALPRTHGDAAGYDEFAFQAKINLILYPRRCREPTALPRATMNLPFRQKLI